MYVPRWAQRSAIHNHYCTIPDTEPCNDEEWTLEVIEDHLCRHAAPEAVSRGERPGEDMAFEVFSNAFMHSQKYWSIKKRDY